MSENRDIDIQVSSTTLGYRPFGYGNNIKEGGKVGAIVALAEGLISKDAYTRLVVENANKFKEVTEQEIPDATFGVSVLASAVNPEQLKGLTGSVDYPYLVKPLSRAFLEEKVQKVKKEGYNGFGLKVALAQEIAYGMLQSSSEKSQTEDTLAVVRSIEEVKPVRIRTCIESISFEDEIQRIKGINRQLKDEGRNVTWVIEPNKKVGSGSLSSFLQMYERIQKENPDLSFGIDLDMGGLPEEHHLLKVLSIMDYFNILPVYISLSGQEYTRNDVRTHLPLGENREFNWHLAKWLKVLEAIGRKVPGLVVETSPAQKDILKDYSEFLKSLKSGL